MQQSISALDPEAPAVELDPTTSLSPSQPSSKWPYPVLLLGTPNQGSGNLNSSPTVRLNIPAHPLKGHPSSFLVPCNFLHFQHPGGKFPLPQNLKVDRRWRKPKKLKSIHIIQPNTPQIASASANDITGYPKRARYTNPPLKYPMKMSVYPPPSRSRMRD